MIDEQIRQNRTTVRQKRTKMLPG